MSPEQFGSNDALPPQPPSGGAASAGVPGYPPAGYNTDRLEREDLEAADRETENPEMVLASLDTATETPAERSVRLGQFLEEHFEGVFPPESKNLAIGECQLFENDCRDLFEEPDLELVADDAKDPGLKERIENLESVEGNDETIAARETEEAEIAAVAASQKAEIIASNAQRDELEARHSNITVPTTVKGRTAALAAENNRTEALAAAKGAEFGRESDKADDLEEIGALQDEFDELKAKHGTIGALRTLLEPGRLKSPAMRAKVQNAIATAEALVSAIPGKEAAIGRLLDQTGLNLGAGSQAEVFASLFTAAEASDEFTDEEVEQLRRVVNDHEDVETGSDMKEAFSEGRETIIDANGNETIVPYDEDHPMQWADGISAYPDGDMIRGVANIGGRRLPFEAPANISGAALTERLNYSVFSAIKESAGVTGGTNQGFEVTQGAKAMDLGDEVFEGQAVRIAKLGLENMIDRFDAGTTLIDAQAIRQIEWGHQWLMPQVDIAGDGGFGDNSERTRAEALGGRGHDGLIWSADDQLNEANYIVACQFIRDRARTGMAEPKIEDLIAHINKMNGEEDKGSDLADAA